MKCLGEWDYDITCSPIFLNLILNREVTLISNVTYALFQEIPVAIAQLGARCS